MLAKLHLKQIVTVCRQLGEHGLNNGVKATIPPLEIDILKPPNDFLGVVDNPALFINKETFKLLSAFHKNWVVNQTIVLKDRFLMRESIDVIGAIIHETGHAFNVAAKIPNSEANAYIFEIEVMLKLLETESPILFGNSEKEVRSFFEKRLSYYYKSILGNAYLADLVKTIQAQFKIEPRTLSPWRSDEMSKVYTYASAAFFFHKSKEQQYIVGQWISVELKSSTY